MTAMNDFRSDIKSQAQEIMRFQGVSEIIFCKKAKHWTMLNMNTLLHIHRKLSQFPSGEPIQDGRPMDQITKTTIGP